MNHPLKGRLQVIRNFVQWPFVRFRAGDEDLCFRIRLRVISIGNIAALTSFLSLMAIEKAALTH